MQRPTAVRFLVHGVQFEDGIYTDDGHIEVDFGLDSAFVYEGTKLSLRCREAPSQQHRQAGCFLERCREELCRQRPRAVVGVGRELGAEADRQTAANPVELSLRG